MTNKELLKAGEARLLEAGINDAKADAYILFEHLTGLKRGDLLLKGDETADDGMIRDYEALIEKRKSRVPVQHITGTADFMGLSFIVDENVLVPRLDTEFLVEEMMREVGDGSSVLDICTGSGCILLSLMRYKNGIKGVGADISAAALDVARKNEERIFNPAEGRQSPDQSVEWMISDMFENVTGTFDVIVSNPPYIRSEVIPELMPEVRDHDPLTALDGGEDGLDFYRIMAKEAPAYLNRHGRLYLEIGFDEADAVTELLRENGFTDIEAMRDYSGNYRVVKAQV